MPDGSVVTNNNWKDNSPADQTTIMSSGLDQFNGMPINDLEAVMVASLPPVDPGVTGSGTYTAIVRGQNNGTGIGLVEVYDLGDISAAAQLANISTRGLVGTDDNVLIGGLIIGPLPVKGVTPSQARVLVRAIGPSLSQANPPVPDALQDPILELHDGQGALITTNDDWQATAKTEIEATGLAPTDNRESAILGNLTAGNYTAIVSGKDGTIGVALVEVFNVK